MTIYSPEQWGAQVDYDSWNDPFTPDDGVALHHGGSSDYLAAQPPYTFEKETALLRGWERYHLGRGWRGLAYGYGVAQSGRIYRIRGFNRYGAHLGDIDGDGVANNDEIIPIIWLASGKHHTVTEAAHESIVFLRRVIIEARSPAATRLYGHKEIQLDKPTSCPGPGGMDYVVNHRYLEDDMATLSEEAQAFFEAMFRDVERNLDPPTSPSALRYLVQHLRNHPSETQRTASEIRKIIADAINNG